LRNLTEQQHVVTRAARERLNAHVGKVYWFTGLSGAGKSTLANALEVALHAKGWRTYLLDGDNVRLGLNKDLGFSDADRAENIRRIAEVSRLMLDAGLVVITAFISPFRRERDMARALVGPHDFVEVYVNTPLEVCEQRDPKGLYRLARAGKITQMTGLDSAYEPPLNPELIAQTDQPLLEPTVQRLMNLLQPHTD
jgi:adenylyl-sulfate kinase